MTLQSPTATHYFPGQSTLGADILVYWIGKIVPTCAAGASRTLDFLRERRAPYPLGHMLRSELSTNEYPEYFPSEQMRSNRLCTNIDFMCLLGPFDILMMTSKFGKFISPAEVALVCLKFILSFIKLCSLVTKLWLICGF